MLKILAFALSVAIQSTTVHAQEVPAIARPAIDYKVLTFYEFKPGAHDRANQIVHDYLLKADAMLDEPGGAYAFRLMTGEWDLIAVLPLDGMGDLEYEISPANAKWITKLIEVAGGPEEARAIIDEFDSLIAREMTQHAMIVERQE